MIIGAARTGTSSLVKYLSKCDEVFIPVGVEPNFFFKDTEYEKGLDYYREKYFSNIVNDKIIGEKSTSYLYGGEKVAKRIKEEFPDVKLVMVLRNPIERAFSNYLFTVKNNVEILDFDYAIKNEDFRKKHYIGKWVDIKPYDYVGRSMYFEQVKAYIDVFGMDKIEILIFEELVKKPHIYLLKLSKFLGFEFSDEIEFEQTNTTYSSIGIAKETYRFIYEKIIKDIDSLSNLLQKDLQSIWNLRKG